MRNNNLVRFCSAAIAVAVASASLVGCTSQEKPQADSQANGQADSQANSQAEVKDEAGVQYMDSEAIAGSYSDKVSGRAVMDITYNENEKYYEVLVHWGSSAKEHTQWTMTAYDEGDSKSLVYENGMREDVITEENGSFTSKTVYEGKKGTLEINEDMTVTWIDDEGEKHIFEKTPNPNNG